AATAPTRRAAPGASRTLTASEPVTINPGSQTSQRLPVGACQPTRFHHPHLVTRAETAIAAGSSLTITSIDRDACGVAALRTKATVMLPTTAARTAISASRARGFATGASLRTGTAACTGAARGFRGAGRLLGAAGFLLRTADVPERGDVFAAGRG